eukprot:Hpha_TRINITY_DN34825_c0_g1::TRINITY_DN34825_c0_g1_i1::g.167857::m.167857
MGGNENAAADRDDRALCVDDGSGSERDEADVSLSRLLGVCAFNFPFGCIVGTMALVILPEEASSLYPTEESVALGAFLGLVGVSQLVCPWAGLRSDHCTARLGRRRPFILGGTVVAALAFCVMYVCSVQRLSHAFAVCLFVGMSAINVIFSAQSGLVPDLLPDNCHGIASGVTAVLQLLGSVCGFVAVHATSTFDFRFFYFVDCGLLLCGSLIVCWVAKERQLPRQEHRLSCSAVLRSYRVNTDGRGDGDESRYDFLWVFCGRTAFYVAVSIQAFMEFYIRDVIGIGDKAERRRALATIVLTGQTTAGLVAYWCGSFSDNEAVGRKIPVYFACVVMIGVYAGFCVLPLVLEQEDLLPAIYAVAAFYGVGNGCYLSVDYALALDTLPDKAAAARDLGVWGVAAFIGSAVGPMIWGTVLALCNSIAHSTHRPGGENAYPFSGYLAMLAGGGLAAGVAALFVAFIRGV